MDTILTEFLKNKSVSPEVAAKKNISIAPDGRIVIPVRDENGNFLYNKYRRSPLASANSTEPKYTYDTGAKSALYNSEILKEPHLYRTVFICEGELKALCLESFGFQAVSSTGGAGTFRVEWAKLLEGRDIFIILDNDRAGIVSAFSIQQKIPNARVAFLPLGRQGKDINDFAFNNPVFLIQLDAIIAQAKRYFIDKKEEFEDKKTIEKEMLRISEMIKKTMWDIQDDRSNSPTGEGVQPWLEIYKELLMREMNRLTVLKKTFTKHQMDPSVGDKFNAAKSVPISSFLAFSSSGFAKSVWNKSDKNPSMKLYHDQNRVYDYSTGQGGDAIDVFMAINDVNFKEAVERLSSGKY